MIFSYTLIRSSSDRPPPGADGSEYRDPQLDIMRKDANLEIYIEVHHIWMTEEMLESPRNIILNKVIYSLNVNRNIIILWHIGTAQWQIE